MKISHHSGIEGNMCGNFAALTKGLQNISKDFCTFADIVIRVFVTCASSLE